MRTCRDVTRALASILLLAGCGASASSVQTEPAPAPESADELGGTVTATPPDAWAEAPTEEPRPIDVRLDGLLTGAVSRLVRRNPMPDGMNHDVDYTGRLACVAERSEGTLTVRVGPPGGQQWDLLTLRISGPPTALEATAQASWHRDSEPFFGTWRELEGELRISDQYPSLEAPLRGEFDLHGLLEARPTRLAGRFVIDRQGQCHARSDGRFISRHTGEQEILD